MINSTIFCGWPKRKSKHVVDYMLRNHITGFGHPSVGRSLPQSEIRLSFQFMTSAHTKHTLTLVYYAMW